MAKRRWAALGAGVFCCAAAVAILSSQIPAGGANPDQNDQGDLQKRIERLESERQALDRAVSDLSRFNPPVGSIIPFSGEWPPLRPQSDERFTEQELGWMLCDGRELTGPAFEPLRRVLGTNSLPDFAGRVLVVAGHGEGLTPRMHGQRGGEETHTLTVEEMPSHTHGVNDPGHGHLLELGRTGKRYSGGGAAALDDDFRRGDEARRPPPPFLAKPEKTGITIQNTGGTRPHNVMQPYAVVNHIIKFR